MCARRRVERLPRNRNACCLTGPRCLTPSSRPVPSGDDCGGHGRIRPSHRRRPPIRRRSIHAMSAAPARPVDLAALSALERRVLWLAVRIVDHANRERPKGDAAQGGRPPGLVGVDGDAHDRAVARRPATREDRVSREAARIAGAARDRVPARPPRPRATSPACATSAACSPTRRAPRTPSRSTSRPARSASARRRRCSARSPTATSTPTRHLDGRALHLAARRRGAGRGQHLGGARRAARAPARQRALDRRPQPPVARPRHPRDPRRGARGAVPDERLGGDRAQVRPAAARGVRADGRRAAAPARSTRCRTRHYQALFGAPDDVVRAAVLEPLDPDERTHVQAVARHGTTAVSGRSCATSAATTSPTCSTRSAAPARRPTGPR